MREFWVPEPVRVDAYQAGHFELIPPGMENFQCSQGIFRKPLHYDGDAHADNRIISAGLTPYILLNLEGPELRKGDISAADDFYSTFQASMSAPFYKPYPYPREIFQRVVDEFGGTLPVVVSGQLDGQAHYVGEPHVQVWTDVPGMGELVGWVESTMLPYLWASSVVATRGRIRKDRMIEVFQKCYPSAKEGEILAMIATRFHDFGRRGGAASQITGIAHLINWLGTDTCDAAYAAQYYLNGGQPFGANSIIAAAHRTVTPWPTEDESYQHAIEKFKGGLLAIVADSYSYARGIRKLAQYAEVIKVAGGFLVGRPDSGDPVDTVIEGLQIFSEAFGFTRQEIGLKVINNAGIIQGDGVSDRVIFEKIYPAVIAAGFSPINVAFGQGEYNHRAVRSDTEEGYKTCLVGTNAMANPYHEVMKSSESLFKRSLPCPVGLDFTGLTYRVFPVDPSLLREGNTGDMRVQFDGRFGRRNSKLKCQRELFEQTRERAWASWKELPPIVADTFDPEIRKMQKTYMDQVNDG